MSFCSTWRSACVQVVGEQDRKLNVRTVSAELQSCRTSAVVSEAQWYLNHIYNCAHVSTRKTSTAQTHTHVCMLTSTLQLPTRRIITKRAGWKGLCRPVEPGRVFYMFGGDLNTFNVKDEETWGDVCLVITINCWLIDVQTSELDLTASSSEWVSKFSFPINYIFNESSVLTNMI